MTQDELVWSGVSRLALNRVLAKMPPVDRDEIEQALLEGLARRGADVTLESFEAVLRDTLPDDLATVGAKEIALLTDPRSGATSRHPGVVVMEFPYEDPRHRVWLHIAGDNQGSYINVHIDPDEDGNPVENEYIKRVEISRRVKNLLLGGYDEALGILRRED